ncbi:MAG TPA: bile acid:sodium symporter family protein [Spirochaetota bacterium]|nr:bile acid:sodium symporter family protein [Spirochaetota bacterium]
MNQTGLKGGRAATAIRATVALVIALFVSSIAYADEDMYRRLSIAAKGTGDLTLIKKLNEASRKLDWRNANETEFQGHLRLLKASAATVTGDATSIFLVRSIKGELFILAVPSKETLEKEGLASRYANLEKMLEDRLTFKIQTIKGTVDGETYLFAHFMEKPKQLPLDRIFKISIVLMLFFVMLGMGLTLTMKDFKIVFQKPKGMLAGAFLQWAIMPLVAVGLGRALGFYEAFPFVFVGMVLIAVSPGGVTSNLMTYYAKGDLALSISLTSFSTVLSIFFTPLLLTVYCAHVPEVSIPVKMVIQTIIILVIVPLAVGMSVRNRWPNFATKATPFFSALGVIALLFLIGAGLLGNLDMFSDTERYGFAFYTMVFVLTLMGMLLGAVIPKLIGINNYQTRAISLETGLRNASLAMAIALLIQDYMGDFYSSMFFTSAIFGLWMYVAGFISIAIYKKLLPVKPASEYEFPVENGEY